MAANSVKILHISDTHCMHWSIEDKFKFDKSADILVHTGDFSNHGSNREIADFAHWLKCISGRFSAIVVIPGNHDWYQVRDDVRDGKLKAKDAVAKGFMRRKFQEQMGGTLPQNLYVLDHEEVMIKGVRIWGSAWCPWNPDRSSNGVGDDNVQRELYRARGAGAKEHRFEEIPDGVDILLTHGPAKGILDCVGPAGRGYGSSSALRDNIYRAKPRMHLFGHIHEQVGQWRKAQGGFKGGIEYRVKKGDRPFPTTGPPPPDYPCEVVSCNPMMYCRHKERGAKARIRWPARLIEVKPRREGAVALKRPASAQEVAPRAAKQRRPQELFSRGSVWEKVETMRVTGNTDVEIINVAHNMFLSADGRVEVRVRGDASDSWTLMHCKYEEGAVFVVHRSTGKFLDTHGKVAKAWNGDGQSKEEILRGNWRQHGGNLRWRIVSCPYQENAFYIVNTRHKMFLDTHGDVVQMWNCNGSNVADVIAKNKTRHVGNIRWHLKRSGQ